MLSFQFPFFRRKSINPIVADAMIFGIGNIGDKYNNTRHNVGFDVVDKLASICTDLQSVKDKAIAANSSVSIGHTAEKKVALVKPTTFVNKSGLSFESSNFLLHLPLSSCLVVVDDYNLPLGSMRFRLSGSDGGHNGLKSIISHVGKDFPRLRIGIGPLSQGEDVIEFVLGAFLPKQQEILSVVIEKALKGITVFLQEGSEKAISVFNSPIR